MPALVLMSSICRPRVRRPIVAGAETGFLRLGGINWRLGAGIALATAALPVFSAVAGKTKPRKVRPVPALEATGVNPKGISPVSQTGDEDKTKSRSLSDGERMIPGPEKAPAGLAAGDSVAASRKIRLPLSRFAGGKTVIRLRGEKAERRLSVPVSPRMRVTSGSIELAFVRSVSLAADSCSLSLLWNGRQLKQEGRNPSAEGGPRRLRAELLGGSAVSKENELRIGSVHRDLAAMKESEGAVSSAALWTEIDLEASWIELSYGWRVADVQADDFPALAGGRPWLESRLLIVTPSLSDGSDDYLQWGGWISQWIAMAGGKEPVEFTHRTALADAGADAVVLGDLGCMLNIEGKLRRMGDEKTRVLHIAEVLAGAQEEEA